MNRMSPKAFVSWVPPVRVGRDKKDCRQLPLGRRNWSPEGSSFSQHLAKEKQESERHLPALWSAQRYRCSGNKDRFALWHGIGKPDSPGFAYKDLPKGRKRPGGRKIFCGVYKNRCRPGRNLGYAILGAARESRVGRKKLPEITVVARSVVKSC